MKDYDKEWKIPNAMDLIVGVILILAYGILFVACGYIQNIN